MPEHAHPSGPGERRPSPGVSPDARERVVELLSQSFADDLITDTELEARLELVYLATTRAELDAITADLGGPTGVATSVLGRQAASGRIDALFSAQERWLVGVVPRDLRVRARMGYVELDLTGAHFAPGVTVIDVRAFMGYVQIRFPAGVCVKSDGRAFLGSFSLKRARAQAAAEATSVVRVTGRAMLGFAECAVGS